MRGDNKNNVVLVADDDLFVRKVIERGLKDIVTMVQVGDGKDVMDAYKAHMPDILFLDIHLPHISGLDLLDQVMQFDPQAYVIMLSADSTLSNVKTTGLKGAKGFMTKPFEKDRLMAYVNMCPTVVFQDFKENQSKDYGDSFTTPEDKK